MKSSPAPHGIRKFVIRFWRDQQLPQQQGLQQLPGHRGATKTSGPIVVLGNRSPNALNIAALNNIFGGAAPVSFVDPTINTVTVNTASPLTGDAAFVETLYLDLLKRMGDTSPAGDAGFWVTSLANHTMTQANVANSIMRSPEALGVQVDGLYLKLLGRSSDTGGKTQFVGQLMNGGTFEQISAVMIGSAEFAAAAGSDSGFVQALYTKLLGRTASAPEVTVWLTAIGNIGRGGVANAIQGSPECRGMAVKQMYGATFASPASTAALFYPLLHRTAAPAAAEVNSWVNSPLDVLAIEAAFAASAEYYAHG